LIFDVEFEKLCIIQDTREKMGKHEHVLKEFQALGINVIREPLPIGDYALQDDWSTVIDTKQDLFEVINNLTSQHERFRKELIKAKNFKIQLIVLIEQNFDSIYDIQFWRVPTFKNGKPRTLMKPETLMKIMLTTEQKYGVKYMFCDKNNTAYTILDILTRKERNGKESN